MGEQEWLTSSDPAAMLDHLLHGPSEEPEGGTSYGRHRSASDRKLRLFACAVATHIYTHHPNSHTPQFLAAIRETDAAADEGRTPRKGDDCYWVNSPDAAHAAREAIDRAVNAVEGMGKTACAALLREIAGNPFRPVTLDEGTVNIDFAEVERRGLRTRFVGRGDDERIQVMPGWLTPTVLTLATAAYDERTSRTCQKCGNKWRTVKTPSDPNGYTTVEVWNRSEGRYRWERCTACHGTGRIDDGTLDPARLAVLADALEESGCDNEEMLRHLRGEERCHECWMTEKLVCETCPGTGWRSLRGPHVRGCWVIDLLTGRE